VGGFLGELGQRLADRWLSLLVLPGALYLAVIAAASVLGQDRSLDAPYLISQVTTWAKAPAAATAAGQVILVAAVLAGAAGVGLAAQALGAVVENLSLAASWRRWPWPLRQLAGQLTDARRVRWNDAGLLYDGLRQEAEQPRREAEPRPDRGPRYAAYQTWRRISLTEPDRPTWCGDRMNAASVRVSRDLHISLAEVWPILWLHLPDQARSEISTARTALTQATTLGGWALLYAPLTGWWWPASAVSVILAVTAWRRIRIATDTYAHLLEAAIRLNLRTLAIQLGVTRGDLPPAALGDMITHDYLATRLPSPAPKPSVAADQLPPAAPDSRPSPP
jgi:hypothetical protein